ncbi:RNA polymerase sigma factor [Cyclobacterium marinum]|uniref:RNA polymerase, sigma-24 subunit, ECF subfamily n=1 Tax=Cyclobacterium marinum (strain ATCC 25205 / DSM 745 / LMG 13164 / NCIMB 1802) TaxID=880070 RepID=G0J427_CYCMS|nr:sigma-70 family RNA polymerase sigma factor [Cyclobacterium marinum]AEL26693.1 RNA polymerase, sigma-24 subunit, ECF subfamily [Cyclobacterium marinum DSM 745]MBI0400056.1 sigma-70 family RNA polymerase sigma factor [Cyclobacterium marinum]MBR9773963.1 sigma-70 family RNA polymerase sigma factor [Cytophagales bacterium]|tara:strand:- start:15626 stop:16321 length:696 start_codon:yes stop_codon:yes gene_type:complete
MELSGGENRDFQLTLTHGEKNTKVAGSFAKKTEDRNNDAVLWAEFKGGNEIAFTALYERYIVDLFNYGEIITADKELIEDSIHDLFVELWKKRTSIGQAVSIRYYLYKALKRKIVKNLEKKRKSPLKESFNDHDFEIVLPHDLGIISGEITSIQKENILKALNQLSRKQKEVIILRFYDGLSFAEISGLLGISQKSTYTLVYRALASMKESMDNKLWYVLALKVYCVSDCL